MKPPHTDNDTMKTNNNTTRTVMLIMLAMHTIGICAQSVFATDIQQKLRNNFEVLTQNRHTYNLYNDSIFIIRDRDQWVSFFLRRAQKNQEIYNSNKAILNDITSYFTNDSIEKSPYDYDVLSEELFKYANNRVNDPFISMHLGKILERYYESGACPPRLNHLPMLYSNLAYQAYNIYNIGNDSTYMKLSYEYTKRAMNPKLKDLPYYNISRLKMLRNIATNIYYTNGYMTLDEMNEQADLLKRLIHADTLKASEFGNKNDYMTILNTVDQYEENLIRNVYLVDSTIMPKQTADSLMRILVKRTLSDPSPTPTANARAYIMLAKLGDITYGKAFEMANDKHNERMKNIHRHKTEVTAPTLQHFTTPILSMLYLNDMSAYSYAKKRHHVKELCDDIEYIYSRLTDQQADTRPVKILNTIVTYGRLTKYLTYDERIHFLNTLNVTTQVTTYAHSAHVGIIAQTLTQAITKHQPQLLVGMLGCSDANDVRKKAKLFANYMYHAAMYHDLGKNSIIPVVNNDYRPLYDEEFAIIKRHPELGLQYLELSPDLARYHDTTLGHHKWYNGKGGYPDSFDNTTSPYRILIDLLTISDCLQAATERVGRNYKGEKTFDTVMDEFRQQAGTRYNPDIVRFIDTHDKVKDWLRDNLDTGWLDIYYDIYNNYRK